MIALVHPMSSSAPPNHNQSPAPSSTTESGSSSSSSGSGSASSRHMSASRKPISTSSESSSSSSASPFRGTSNHSANQTMANGYSSVPSSSGSGNGAGSSASSSTSASRTSAKGVQFAYQVPPSRLAHHVHASSATRQTLPHPAVASTAMMHTVPSSPRIRPSPFTGSFSAGPSSSSLSHITPQDIPSPKNSYDIAAYAPSDLIKLLASLLTQIAATNDALTTRNSSGQRSSAHSSSPSYHHPSFQHTTQHPRPPIWYTLTTASRAALSTPSSTLTFHARNIPSISLEAYLLRILKYCPTTNHVFLSLLVYFDRMAKLTEDIEGDEEGENGEVEGGAVGVAEELAFAEAMDVEREGDQTNADSNWRPTKRRRPTSPNPNPIATSPGSSTAASSSTSTPTSPPTPPTGPASSSKRKPKAKSRSFVIDSYNIHRLVIAGVTVASKFFSDVFYTNGRYAKVGGLPLHELNQLELQFLLLNDFRLVISGEEMQKYAEQLILFSKSQANPIVLRMERRLGEAGVAKEKEKEKTRLYPNGFGTHSSSPPVAARTAVPQPPVMTRHYTNGERHAHIPLPSSSGSPSSSSEAGQQQQAWPSSGPSSNMVSSPGQHLQPQQPTSQYYPQQELQRKGVQTPKVGAVPNSSHPMTGVVPNGHHYPHHPQTRQGEFSRAYDSDSEDDDDYDDDNDNDNDADERSLHSTSTSTSNYETETETEGETDAGETDASGSTTSDEPTVRPRRAYVRGRRESMGSFTGERESGEGSRSRSREREGRAEERTTPEVGARMDTSP